MKNKVNAKVIDERIRQAFQNSKPELIEDLIDLRTLEGVFLWNNLIDGREISAGLLQEILIGRDKKVLGLKNCEISEVYAEDLELDEEFAGYNIEIFEAAEEQGEITIIKGTDKDGKENVLYYYDVEIANDYLVNRQQRIFNKNGDIESMSRQTMFSDGRCEHLDDAVIVYQYDKHGNKKAGLSQDNLDGMKYFEYDKSGNVVLKIEKEYIEQDIQEDGKTYTICDGYFEPSAYFFGGFKLKSPTSMFELTPEDMQRYVSGDISPERREALMDGMSAERKEEALGVLRAVEPIFESCKTANILDKANIQKMQKCVQWFSGFAKRLEMDPKLAVQDEAVMSTMRGAVGRNVGKTRNAEMDLKTPVKEEIKEKEHGDN